MIKATKKQKEAFKEVMKGETVMGAMKKAGYKDTTVDKPANLTKSKGWKELIDQALPDELLAKVHKEGLKATDPQSLIVGYEPGKGKGMKSVPIVKIMHAPDYGIRHKYLDTAYKIKNKFPKEGVGIAIQVNIDKAREQYA